MSAQQMMMLVEERRIQDFGEFVSLNKPVILTTSHFTLHLVEAQFLLESIYTHNNSRQRI